MSILLLAEHNNRQLALSTLSAYTAATQIGGDITLFVAGHQCAAVAQQAATLPGLTRVLWADSPHLAYDLAENITAAILPVVAGFSHILAPANATSKEVMPRLAALLDVGQLSEITTVINAEQFQRPIYAGNAIATLTALDAIKVITVRASAFEKTPYSSNTAPIESLTLPAMPTLSTWVNDVLSQSERPELSAANRIVSGGRGVGHADNFALINALADKLGAAVGASRAAVDAGFAANDLQVGQTGKIVAPELYMAFGISGAIQHLAGMKDSKIIVAVNKDEDAPIFQIADYGLVGDLLEVLPQLTQHI